MGEAGERELRVPRPVRAALPLAALSAVPLAVAAAGVLPWAAALVIAAGCAFLAAVRGLLASDDLRALRRTADDLLRTGAKPHPQSELLSWRAAELTSARNRRILVRSLRGIVRELEGRSLPSAVPLNRAGTRPHADVIRLLAERLEDLQRPVSPRGVLLVQELLTDGASSPLYVRARSSELRPSLGRCLAALDSPEGLRRPELSASSDEMGSNGFHRSTLTDRYMVSVSAGGKR